MTLRDLGLDRSGVICVERVDAALTGQPPVAADCGALRHETALIREMVEAVIHGGQAYGPSFTSCWPPRGLIDAVGFITNSQVLIVAAMVGGLEYSAIIAAALGITRRDHGVVRDGLLALLSGFVAAIAVTLLFGLAVRGSGKAPVPFLPGVRPVADFIKTPDGYSVVVAVLAGIVGVVSLTQGRANTLIGVFIWVTIIPAAASIGVSIVFSSWGEARGSAAAAAERRGAHRGRCRRLTMQRRIWRRRTTQPPRR